MGSLIRHEETQGVDVDVLHTSIRRSADSSSSRGAQGDLVLVVEPSLVLLAVAGVVDPLAKAVKDSVEVVTYRLALRVEKCARRCSW